MKTRLRDSIVKKNTVLASSESFLVLQHTNKCVWYSGIVYILVLAKISNFPNVFQISAFQNIAQKDE